MRFQSSGEKTLRGGLAVGFALLLASPDPAAAGIVISSTPFTDPLRQEAVFLSLVNIISSSLGMEVRYAQSPSYEAVVEGFKQGTIDVATIGAVGYVEARRAAKIRAILRPIRDRRSFYSGAIMVKRDAPYKTLPELRGKRFAFADRYSTSGFLYPSLLLRRAGLDPLKDFTVSFAGGHALVAEKIASGDVDAGAAFDGAQRFLADPSALRVLAFTEPIPSDPVVVSSSLSDPVVQRLREIFLDLAFDPRAKGFFELMNIEGFVPATDEQYARLVADIESMRPLVGSSGQP